MQTFPRAIRSALAAVFVFVGPASPAQTADWRYSVQNGEATITRYDGPAADVVVPATLGGVPVTTLQSYVFYRDNIRSVAIPASVRILPRNAFYSDGLQSITVDPANQFFSSADGALVSKPGAVLLLYPRARAGSYAIPDGVLAIGEYAFSGATALNSVSIPNTVTNIGVEAFFGCRSLSEIAIPPSVQTIRYRAFFQCSGLTNVVIQPGVSVIEDSAFYGCYSLQRIHFGEGLSRIYAAFEGCQSLESVALPNSLTNLAPGAFARCRSLTSVEVGPDNPALASVNGVLIDRAQTRLILYPPGRQGSYTIPAGITTIGDNAFAWAAGLTELVAPAGLASIGSSAFLNCSNLTMFEIPPSLRELGASAFAGSGLGAVTVPGGVTAIGPAAFQQCPNLQTAVMEFGVNTIGAGAFLGCLNLKQAILPNSLVNIDTEAFKDCASLSGIAFPNSLTNITSWAFFGTALTNVVIPSSVQRVAWYAFRNCAALTNIVLPDALLETQALSLCPSLRTVFFTGNAPAFEATMFDGSPLARIYYLPGTAGWDRFPDGQAFLWNPQVSTFAPSFGVRDGQFGFVMTGTAGIPVILEACSNLAEGIWAPIAQATLENGFWRYLDPEWEQHPTRLYRWRAP